MPASDVVYSDLAANATVDPSTITGFIPYIACDKNGSDNNVIGIGDSDLVTLQNSMNIGIQDTTIAAYTNVKGVAVNSGNGVNALAKLHSRLSTDEFAVINANMFRATLEDKKLTVKHKTSMNATGRMVDKGRLYTNSEVAAGLNDYTPTLLVHGVSGDSQEILDSDNYPFAEGETNEPYTVGDNTFMEIR